MGKKVKSKNKGYDPEKARNAKAYLEKCGFTVLTQGTVNEIKREAAELVMNRAYVGVMASFLDNARTFWKTYFKSKKKMEEYCGMCINNVEMIGVWVAEDKILEFDEIAEWIYENYGKDFRTEWKKCHDEQMAMEEMALKQRERAYMLNTKRLDQYGKE